MQHIFNTALDFLVRQRILVFIRIHLAHAVSVIQKRDGILKPGLGIRRRHHHRDQLHALLLGRRRQTIQRLRSRTGLKPRSPFVLFQQLIGTGEGKRRSALRRLMLDILHPDLRIFKHLRIFRDQFPGHNGHIPGRRIMSV